MAASVATGSPLPESGLLQGGAETDADALIEQSRQLAATPFGDRDRLASILLPVQDVPLCVVTGLLLGGLPDYARGRVPIARSILRFVNSWHAVGPALVLIAAGQPAPTPQHLPVYALALLAQFAFDFGSTALRDRLGLGVSPSSILR